MNPTPIQVLRHHFGPGQHLYVKRDDLYRAPGGAPGGKARTCEKIIRDYLEAVEYRTPLCACKVGSCPHTVRESLLDPTCKNSRNVGVVTAGSRSSPQVNIVAQICKALNLPCIVHTPQGKPGPEVAAAVGAGAVRVEHMPGYNTVLVKRARDDAEHRGWCHVPFGMDTMEAVAQTASQVTQLSVVGMRRIVVPVGSGMSLAGIVSGLSSGGLHTYDIPKVLGVVVGADPTKRLDRYAPMWRFQGVELVDAGVPYDRAVKARIGDIDLDPIYEAKCVPFLQPGDLFWVVGVRQTLQ